MVTLLAVIVSVIVTYIVTVILEDRRRVQVAVRETNRRELLECLEHARTRLSEVAYYYESSVRELEKYPEDHDQKMHVRERRLELEKYMHNLERTAVLYDAA